MAIFADYAQSTLTTIRRQTAADVASAREEHLVKQIDTFFYLYSHFALSDGEHNVHDAKSGCFCSLVSENVKQLCVYVCALTNSNLFFSADCVISDSEYQITMAQVIRNTTNSGIRPQQERSMIIDKKEAVTFLPEPTRSFIKLECKTESTRRARVRDISVDTF